MLRIALLLIFASLSLNAVEYSITSVQASLHTVLPFKGDQMPYLVGGTTMNAAEGQRFLVLRACIETTNWTAEDSSLRIEEHSMSITPQGGEAIAFVGWIENYNLFQPTRGMSIWINRPHSGATEDREYLNLVAVVDAGFESGILNLGTASAAVITGESALLGAMPISAEIGPVEILAELNAKERNPKDVTATLKPASGRLLQVHLTWTVSGHIDPKAAGSGISASWNTKEIAIRLDNGLLVNAVASQYYAGERGLGITLGSRSMSINRPDASEVTATCDYYFIIPNDSSKGELFLGSQSVGSLTIPE